MEEDWVNGRVRLVDGLALRREDDEFKLGYYNSMTTWIRDGSAAYVESRSESE